MRPTRRFTSCPPVRTAMMAAAILAVVGSAPAGEPWRQMGAPITIEQTTPIAEIVADPDAFHDRVVRIEGRIASVCTQEGCFIEVVPEQGGDGIVINFPGLVHTFPIDCAGLVAEVEGRVYRKIYPHARVDHWQHHSFRPGVEIQDFSLVTRMDAHGARVGGARSSIPAPRPMRAVEPNRVDLDRVGFEAEAFGIDRRRIEPGGTVPRPSTGGNRWLVLCRRGQVVVERENDEHVELTSGELSFLPAGIDFEIRNPTAETAVVELVYSKAVAPEHTH